MGKLSKAAQEEIAAAVKILREDGVHIHKTYAQFQEGLKNPPKEDEPPKPPKPGEGDPPPENDPPVDPPKKKSAWWG